MIIKLDKLSKGDYSSLTKFLTSDANRVHSKELKTLASFDQEHKKCERSGPGHFNFWVEFAFLKEAREDDKGTFSVVLEVLEKIYSTDKGTYSVSQSFLRKLMSSAGLFPDIKEKIVRVYD